ncbi:MAG: hypothetical protein J1F64_05985 [Oscillospiraceae bacterium]|nr:hypothetical protein [Oscillospiraceae bacterium]
MKKKYRAASAAAIAGAIVLVVSSIATYATSSGYTSAKNAMKNMLYQDNFSAEMAVSFYIDGKQIDSESSSVKFDRNNPYAPLNRMESSGGVMRYSTYIQDGSSIRVYKRDITDDLTPLDRVYIRDIHADSPEALADESSIFGAKDSKELTATIRFAELLCDTLVGDLKNNIILTDSDSETNTFTMSLDAYQIPELYQAGFNMIMTGASNYDDRMIDGKYIKDMTEEEFYALMETGRFSEELLFANRPSLSGAEAVVSIDKEGRLRRITGEVEFSGADMFNKEHTAKFRLDISVHDYDTTVCDRIDLSEFEGTDAISYDSYSFEEEISSIEEQLARLAESSDEKDTAHNDYLVGRLNKLNEVVNSAEYARLKEIRDALLFGRLGDEERNELVAEKLAVINSIDYALTGTVGSTVTAVQTFNGADGPTAITIVTSDAEIAEITEEVTE